MDPKKRDHPPFLTLLLIILILSSVVASYFVYQNNQTLTSLKELTKPTLTPSPNPFPPPRTQKDESSGRSVYTNFEYGFLFGYPSDMFIFSMQEPYGLFLSNKPNAGSPMEVGTDGLWLSVSYESLSKERQDYFQSIIEMKNNTTDKKRAITKLSTLTAPEASGASFFQGVPENFVGEPAYAYQAFWVRGSRTYRLVLGALTERGIRKYKSLFDDLVSSFTFISSREAPSS